MTKESHIQIRVSDRFKDRLAKKAEALGMNLSEYIRYLIQKDLE